MYHNKKFFSWKESKNVSMFHKGVRVEQGFSLIELLVGIVIIGLLIAIIIPLDAAHRREAIKASVKSDVRHTNSNIIQSLTKNPKAEGFILTEPTVTASAEKNAVETVAYKTAESTEPVKVSLVTSKGTKIIVTDVATGDPTTATGDGAWNSYQITGTNSDVPGYYYTYISTIGQYRSNEGVDTGTPSASSPIATTAPTLAPAIDGIMVTTWDTSLPNCSTIILPIGFVDNATLDWGDGTVENGNSQNKTHTYTDAPGLKTVTFKGKFAHYGSMSNNSNKCLTRVDRWENTGTEDLKGAFAYAHNLTHIAAIPSTTTDLSYAFAEMQNTNIDLSKLDVSNVKTMENAFAGSSFNQPLNSWNVSNVTNMRNMFLVTNFNQPLDSWNVSNVTDMRSMFSGSKFNQNINNWNVSNVTNMGSVFSNKVFNQPLNNWNVSNVTNMEAMFGHNVAFNQNINNWNVSNVTNMRMMFNGAKAYTQPLNSWNVSNVTNMDNFIDANLQYSVDLSSWNVTKVGSNHYRFTESTYMTAAKLPKWVA